MSDLEKEVEHWKFVAAYLASCHAATLEGMPKRTSKSERSRHVSICLSAAKMLRGLESPRYYGVTSKADVIESDISRCERAAKLYAEPS